MRINHVTSIIVSGTVWLGIGFFLLVKGLKFIVASIHADTPLLSHIAPLIGGKEQAALLLIVAGLIAGFVKGRLVLIKTVKKVVGRILSLQTPLKITQLYGTRYFILLAIMVGLGMGMKWMNLQIDLRGFIDVAIGSALINGAFMYYRYAAIARKQQQAVE